MKAEHNLTLDIGTDGIRMAVVVSPASSLPRIIDSGFIAYDEHSQLPKEAVAAMALKQLLDEKKPAAKRASISIDGQSVFSRLVKLPMVGKDRVEQTIRHEAVQNIPFPIEDVVWDAHVIDPESDEPEVLLVAVKADLVEGLVHAVTAAGLGVEKMSVAPVALANALHTFCNTSEPTLLIDSRPSSANLVLLDGQRAFFRAVPIIGNDEARRKQEIERSISFYTGQQGGNAPTQTLESLPNVERDYAVCLGLACSSLVDIDLIPSAIVLERDLKRRTPLWLASAIVLMLVLGVWIFSFESRVKALATQTALTQREVSTLRQIELELEPLEQRIDELYAVAEIYRTAAEYRTFWIEALSAVNQMLPDGMFLISSDPIDNGIRISVVSYLDREGEGKDSVKQFRDLLRSHDLFSDETSVHSRPSKMEFARVFVLDVFFEGVQP